MWRFLNFCANFLLNFSKFYKSLWWVQFCYVSSNWNFGDAIAVQDLSVIHVWNFVDAIAVQNLSGIHVWNFVRCSPLPRIKSWRCPWLSFWYYDFSRWSFWHFLIQFCSSIKFYSNILHILWYYIRVFHNI